MNRAGAVLLMLVGFGIAASARGIKDEELRGAVAPSTAPEAATPEAAAPEAAAPDSPAIPADWERVASGDRVLVRGRVRLVGNAPFSELVITDESGRDWYIDTSDRTTLGIFEQRIISVEGTVILKEQILADGKRLKDRRVLKKCVLPE